MSIKEEYIKTLEMLRSDIPELIQDANSWRELCDYLISRKVDAITELCNKPDYNGLSELDSMIAEAIGYRVLNMIKS